MRREIRIAVFSILWLVTGVLGIAYLFGTNDSMWITIATKPIGALLIAASYMFNERIKRNLHKTKSN